MKDKRPGLGIMIVEHSRPMSAPPSYGGKSDMSAENHRQETPSTERDEDAGSIAPTPESVGYHTSAETCGSCEYMKGDSCAFLKMPVGPGDHCQRYEGKTEDMGRAYADEGSTWPPREGR